MAQARWKYWLGMKAGLDPSTGYGDGTIFPLEGNEGFTREEALVCRTELIKQGIPNTGITTIITIEDEG